jgi:valyl-tRNA synthetase
LVKLWNASGFASNLLATYDPKDAIEPDYQLLDKWILSKTENLTKKVTEAYERCQFNIAVEDTRNFTWHVFCDFYVEAVKDRLYKSEIYGAANRAAAQYTLYEVLYRMLQLLAPVTPHLTEEIYQCMYLDGKGFKSIQVTPWPKVNPAVIDEIAEKDGDLITAIMSEVRRDKAEKKLPLNAPIKNLVIYTKDDATAVAIRQGCIDISATLKIENIKVFSEKAEGRQVAQYEVYIKPDY